MPHSPIIASGRSVSKIRIDRGNTIRCPCGNSTTIAWTLHQPATVYDLRTMVVVQQFCAETRNPNFVDTANVDALNHF